MLVSMEFARLVRFSWEQILPGASTWRVVGVLPIQCQSKGAYRKKKDGGKKIPPEKKKVTET